MSPIEIGALDLNRIRLFKLVVELGSFSKTAQRLNVAKSNVSRNISILEQQLNIQLIYRTTRKFQLTLAGKQLYAEAREPLSFLEDAVSKLVSAKEEVKGLIRISAPADLEPIFLPILIDFTKLHPQVRFECKLTNELVDIVGAGFDVAFRIGALKSASLLSRNVGQIRAGLVASPAFLERYANKLDIKNLKHVPSVTFRQLGNVNKWNLISGKRQISTPISPRFVVDTTRALRSLALNGLGVTMIPLVVCQSDLRTGALVRVFSEWHFADVPAQILIPSQKLKTPRIQIFVDHLVNALKQALAA